MRNHAVSRPHLGHSAGDFHHHASRLVPKNVRQCGDVAVPAQDMQIVPQIPLVRDSMSTSPAPMRGKGTSSSVSGAPTWRMMAAFMRPELAGPG